MSDKMLKDEVRDINLGYVTMANWQEDEDIWPEWMKEDEHYQKEINSNPADGQVTYEWEKHIEVTINYPLSKPYTFQLCGTLSRREVVSQIVKHYRKIYEDPEKWGIWGHCLGDLMLHTLYVYEGGRAEVGVDS